MAAVGVLTLHLRIEGSHSLKDKRKVVRSLKDRLRRRFNVSVAEVDHADSWQRSEVAVAAVAGDAARVERVLAAAEREAEELLGGDLAGVEVEIS